MLTNKDTHHDDDDDDDQTDSQSNHTVMNSATTDAVIHGHASTLSSHVLCAWLHRQGWRIGAPSRAVRVSIAAPPPPQPVSELMVTNITHNTARVSWSMGPIASRATDRPPLRHLAAMSDRSERRGEAGGNGGGGRRPQSLDFEVYVMRATRADACAGELVGRVRDAVSWELTSLRPQTSYRVQVVVVERAGQEAKEAAAGSLTRPRATHASAAGVSQTTPVKEETGYVGCDCENHSSDVHDARNDGDDYDRPPALHGVRHLYEMVRGRDGENNRDSDDDTEEQDDVDYGTMSLNNPTCEFATCAAPARTRRRRRAAPSAARLPSSHRSSSRRVANARRRRCDVSTNDATLSGASVSEAAVQARRPWATEAGKHTVVPDQTSSDRDKDSTNNNDNTRNHKTSQDDSNNNDNAKEDTELVCDQLALAVGVTECASANAVTQGTVLEDVRSIPTATLLPALQSRGSRAGDLQRRSGDICAAMPCDGMPHSHRRVPPDTVSRESDAVCSGMGSKVSTVCGPVCAAPLHAEWGPTMPQLCTRTSSKRRRQRGRGGKTKLASRTPSGRRRCQGEPVRGGGSPPSKGSSQEPRTMSRRNVTRLPRVGG